MNYQAKKVICCGDEYLSGFCIVNHLRDKHFSKRVSFTGDKFPCVVTNSTSAYKRFESYKNHLNDKHLETLSRNIWSQVQVPRPVFDLPNDGLIDDLMDHHEFLQEQPFNLETMEVETECEIEHLRVLPVSSMPTFKNIDRSKMKID